MISKSKVLFCCFPIEVLLRYLQLTEYALFPPLFCSTGHERSLYWRKMMEYFTVERPFLCLNEIIHKNADACGVLWRNNHYSGNFWAASCHHLLSLPVIPINDTTQNLRYIAAELWIGLNRTKKTFVSLKNADMRNHRLYRELIKPEMYWDEFVQ